MVLTEKMLIMDSSTGGTLQMSTVRDSFPKVHRLQYLWNHHEFLRGICESRVKPQIQQGKPKHDGKRAVGIGCSNHWFGFPLPNK